MNESANEWKYQILSWQAEIWNNSKQEFTPNMQQQLKRR